MKVQDSIVSTYHKTVIDVELVNELFLYMTSRRDVFTLLLLSSRGIGQIGVLLKSEIVKILLHNYCIFNSMISISKFLVLFVLRTVIGIDKNNFLKNIFSD